MCVWQCGFLSPSSPPGALCGLGGHLQVHLLSGLPPSTHIHGIGALSGPVLKSEHQGFSLAKLCHKLAVRPEVVHFCP